MIKIKANELKINKLTATEKTLQYYIEELKDKGVSYYNQRRNLENRLWDTHPQERKRQLDLFDKIIEYIRQENNQPWHITYM